MNKLSLQALSQRADAIATEDLLNSINGGTENDCHPNDDRSIGEVMADNANQRAEDNQEFAERILGWLGF